MPAARASVAVTIAVDRVRERYVTVGVTAGGGGPSMRTSTWHGSCHVLPCRRHGKAPSAQRRWR
eukprot:362980-Chlamydomonas_euryale.AAC.1